jgi:LysM repeat protein
MLVVERLPAPARRAPGSQPAAPQTAPQVTSPAPAPEPVVPPAVLDGDVLVFRLGGAPGLAAAPAPAPPPQQRPVAPPPQPTPALQQTTPPAGHDTYVVKAGDTLSSIAQRELGSAQLAGELARLNKIADPAALRVGQVLKLR